MIRSICNSATFDFGYMHPFLVYYWAKLKTSLVVRYMKERYLQSGNNASLERLENYQSYTIAINGGEHRTIGGR